MKHAVTCIALSALMLLGACGSDSGSEPQTQASAPSPPPQPAAQAKAAMEDPTARMARAVGDGKPGAAVEIKYEFAGKPAVGSPTELEIALIPRAGVDAMEATISGMEGVTLAGPLTASFPDVEPGKPYTHRFSVLPDRSGVFYVTVSVNTHIGGSSLGRTFSIPFVVGDAPVQKKAEPQTDEAGEAIQPMKAEESGM